MPSANSELAELSPVGSAVLNAIGIISYTGAQIAIIAAGSPSDGRMVYCNTTGGGYSQGHWYGWDNNLGKFIDLIAFPDHFLYFAQNYNYAMIDRRLASKEMWYYNSSGSGAGVNHNTPGVIELVTGTTTTGWAEIVLGGLNIDFGQPALFMVRYLTPSTVTGQIVKMGLRMDRAGAATSSNNKFGIEYCDADTDWQIHSGDGTDNSNFDTGDSVEGGNNGSWYLSHDPGNSITAIREDLVTYEKNTDVPAGIASSSSRDVSISISNNNGSSTSRTLSIYSCYAVIAFNDPDWVK